MIVSDPVVAVEIRRPLCTPPEYVPSYVATVKTSVPGGTFGPGSVHGQPESVTLSCTVAASPDGGAEPFTLTSLIVTERVPAPTYCAPRCVLACVAPASVNVVGMSDAFVLGGGFAGFDGCAAPAGTGGPPPPQATNVAAAAQSNTAGRRNARTCAMPPRIVVPY